MQKVRVFLNTRASQGQSRDWQSLIRRQLFRSELDFISPSDERELRAEINRATADKVDVIVSVGGDGTFHTLIQQLAEQESRFLVLPAGTANDLARELGIHNRVQEALEFVRLDEWKAIDLITVNGIHMATNGGIGIIGDVAESINQWRRSIPGFQSLMSNIGHPMYTLILGLKLLGSPQKKYRLRLTSPDYRGELESPLLMINNQPSVAGSFKIAPDTRNDDGKFNVSIFTHHHLCQLLTGLYRVRQHIPPSNDPRMLSFETDHLEIELLDSKDQKMAFYGDGELLTSARRLEIGIKPQSLRVYSHQLPYLNAFDTSNRLEVRH
ncbi:MAG TPA: diacylglycerol kinase family protein [Oligoflexus sp.]|uniref:diacylglycerol/lipid kinase family protein n=1 Tax=Oligoflexus sp. TaxID=1971216 RepID=UPI002D5B8070|nr:diacylglycerol kinase family protein [Oligoflexus sp.]HYX31675.1 diacylglycerol kinase family protein [Oligoflexus sp.]